MINEEKLTEYLINTKVRTETLRAQKWDDENDNPDRNQRKHNDNPSRANLPPPLPQGMIHMLIKFEGSASRKWYAGVILHLDHKEENIIHRRNGTRVKYLHSHPLLITECICGWDTERVYTDTGSNMWSSKTFWTNYRSRYLRSGTTLGLLLGPNGTSSPHWASLPCHSCWLVQWFTRLWSVTSS